MLINEVVNNQIESQLNDFAKWACRKLNIKTNPKLCFDSDMNSVHDRRTFGSTNSNGEIWVHVGSRIPADIMRTLCHELVHHKQFEEGLASDAMSDEQRQSIEDVANAMAGRLLRVYGKIKSEIYDSPSNSI